MVALVAKMSDQKRFRCAIGDVMVDQWLTQLESRFCVIRNKFLLAYRLIK